MKRIIIIGYITIAMVMSLTLAIFMSFGDGQSSFEEKVLVPSLFDDGKLNQNISGDIENYVSKKFGFRQDMLGLYTLMQEQFFSVSPISQVVVGKNGYLFYGDTVADYLGTSLLSKREQFQIVHSLELMQEYVESQNGQFLFVIAPNKNSLYDQMPERYIKTNQKTNAQTIISQLDYVDYIDLFEIFQSQKEELYYKSDSHWNNEGARLVYHEMMMALNQQHDDFLSYPKQQIMIKGDLYNMLYPQAKENESSLIYDKEKNYEYLTKTRNHEQTHIETYNDKGENSLLMFRDSFANNLIDYLSDAYQYAVYDKSLFYQFQLMEQYQANRVVLEIAERNIKLIQESRPMFLAPVRQLEQESVLQKAFVNSFEMTIQDNYTVFKGTVSLDEQDEKCEIYVEADGAFYEMTPQQIDNQNGFFGCIPAKDYKDIHIYVKNQGTLVRNK